MLIFFDFIVWTKMHLISVLCSSHDQPRGPMPDQWWLESKFKVSLLYTKRQSKTLFLHLSSVYFWQQLRGPRRFFYSKLNRLFVQIVSTVPNWSERGFSSQQFNSTVQFNLHSTRTVELLIKDFEEAELQCATWRGN